MTPEPPGLPWAHEQTDLPWLRLALTSPRCPFIVLPAYVSSRLLKYSRLSCNCPAPLPTAALSSPSPRGTQTMQQERLLGSS